MADNLNFKKKLMGLPGNLYNFACRLTADRDTFCCFVRIQERSAKAVS